MTIGLAHVNGARLHYEIDGREDAPGTVVFIHAGIADSRMWNPQFSLLAREYRVLRYDQRGYGQSEALADEYSRLDDLHELLRQLGIARAALVGCSVGGRIALDFALEHPTMTAGLALVCSAPGGFQSSTPDDPALDAAITAAFESADVDQATTLETDIWVTGLHRTRDQVDADVWQLVYAMNRIAVAHEINGINPRERKLSPPAVDRLGEIAATTLVIVGAVDLPHISEAADYMLEQLPHAHRVVIDDAAHLPNLEHPDEFNDHLSTWLRGVFPR